MGGARGGSKNKSSKSARRARRDAAVKAKVNANRNPIQSRLQSAGFTQKQLNNLKTQHASFKSHQKAGTLSTHQKKYSTGSYALSGAQRAQQAAKDRIAAQKKTTSQSKNWGTNLKDSIVSNWNKLDKALTRPDNYKNLPSFMGDAQVTSGDWTRAKDTAVNIGKWGAKFAKNTASEFGDMMMGKPTNLNLSTQKPSLLNTATAFTKGRIDNIIGLGGLTPESWGIADKTRNYLSSTAYSDPTLKAAYSAGSFYPGANLAVKGLSSLGKINTKGRLLQSIIPATAKTLRGATLTSGKQLDRGLRIAKGVRDGTYTGAKAQQISGALKAGNLKSLGLQRVYHGTSTDAARKITQGALSGVGKGFRESMGMLGKGAYSSTKRGVAGSYRGNFLKGTPFNTNINLTPGNILGAGVTGAVAGGQLRNLYDKAIPDENKTKSLLNFLNSTPGTYLRKGIEAIPGGTGYLTGKAEAGLQPAFEMAGDMKGLKGWWAGRQVKQAQRHLDNQDLSGLLKQATMVHRRYEESEGKIPGTWGLVKGGVGDAWNRFIGRDPNELRPTQVTSPVTASRDAMRRGRGRGGKMRVQDVDLNKIGAQTSNTYAAAQDEQDLTAFWQRQNLINTAAEQRLKDIQSDRSAYSKLVTELDTHGSAYRQEIDRLKPYGKSYTDELARIQPIGKEYSDELARIQPFGKQYSDELARLQPYGKQFTSSIADLTKGRDELRGYQGKWKHPDDVKFLKEQLPQYDKAISDLQNQYKTYQTSIADLTKEQKNYQSYLGEVQSGYKDYQSYLGEVQTGQKELADYTKQIGTERSQLEDYASAFTSAKQASDQAARSYTVRAQQGISGNVRQGVSGIRARGGFRTIGSNRNKSAKRRFNRDFRIGSFGDTSMSPINV